MATRPKPSRKRQDAQNTRKAPAKPTKKPTAAAKAPPPNPDELFEARIWALREEGRSVNEISKKIGVNRKTVSRVLAEDSERLLGLINDAKMQRLRQFEDLETIAMQAIVRTIISSQVVFFASKTPGAKPGDIGNALDPMMTEQFLDKGAGWGSFYAKVAADASLRVNNLRGYGAITTKPAGGAAQAQGTAGAIQAAASAAVAQELGTGALAPMQSEEAVIEEAIRMGRTDLLPPEQQEKAAEIMAQRSARADHDRESGGTRAG
jgi:hypothetical protein